MNQTRSHSISKKFLALILAVIMVLSLMPMTVFAQEEDEEPTQQEQLAETQDTVDNSSFLRIFHLDCGRKYFSVSQIKGIIDQLAANHYTHIQLAFGNNGFRFLLNDMAVTANGTTYSSEKVTGAIQAGNRACITSSIGELSESDMNDIIAYAKGKGIGVIPMFNGPGHMHALVNAMGTLGIGNAEYGSDGGHMNMETAGAVEFAKALQQKYIDYFAGKGSKYYNISADEYAFDSITNDIYQKVAEYVNDLAVMITTAKMTPMAFNDVFYWKKWTLPEDFEFNKDYKILYWSNGGNRASVADLIGKGFEIVNTNDAWYYVLGDALSSWQYPQWQYKDAVSAIQSVKVTQMKGYTGDAMPIGSVLCCWCDDPSKCYPCTAAENNTGVNDVYALIQLMAAQNPNYFKASTVTPDPDPDPEPNPDQLTITALKTISLADDAENGVTVTANQLVSWASSDEGVLKVTPIVEAVVQAADDAVDTVRTTQALVKPVKAGSATLTATNADGETASVEITVTKDKLTEKKITVKVGGTKTVSVDGDVSGDIAGSGIDTAVATVSGEYLSGTSDPTLEEITSAADLTDGQYLIVNQRNHRLLTGSNGSSDTTRLLTGNASTTSKALWTVTKSGSKYTLKWMNGEYLSQSGSTSKPADSTAIMTGTETNLGLEYVTANDTTEGLVDEKGKAYIGYWRIIANSTYYLNNLANGTSAGFWWNVAYSPATDAGSRWAIYRIIPAQEQNSTVLTFTGVSPETTTAVIGGVRYVIEVVAEQTIEIPITIIDYRADGLLFDWTYGYDASDGKENEKSYCYSLVHGECQGWGVGIGNGAQATFNSTTSFYEVNGETANYIEKIPGTTLQRTGNRFNSTTFYSHGSSDNDWSRAGLVEAQLVDGYPVYTDAAVQYVAGLLKNGYHNELSDPGATNYNKLLYETFLADGAFRSVSNTAADEFSPSFAVTKSWDDITTAYDLAWYLLNTFYKADTNMTTVIGKDGVEHTVPIYGMAVNAYDKIILKETDNGVYSLDAENKNLTYDRVNRAIYASEDGSNLGFYPIDGLGYDEILGDTTDNTVGPAYNDANEQTRPDTPNGNFTLRGEAQFVYEDGLYFTFKGDDDVYMFINGKLALDLGGAHGSNEKTVRLETLDAAEYGLEKGKVATFTFFYMERCSDASTFAIETNLTLAKRDIDVEKRAYSDPGYSNEITSNSVVNNNGTVYYDLVVVNKSTEDMSSISFADKTYLNGSAAVNGSADFGAGVDAAVTPGSTILLGQTTNYVIFETDEAGVEIADTRTPYDSLSALSSAVAAYRLPGGHSLHVRFLTANTKLDNASIVNFRNRVTVTAVVAGYALEDSAIHDFYSYDAKDTEKTYVVDFGLPLEITSIFAETAESYIRNEPLTLQNTLKYGTVKISGSGYNTSLTYQLKDRTTIDAIEELRLKVAYTFGVHRVDLTKIVYIIPATTVYYEDSFVTFQNGTGAAEKAIWSAAGKNANDTPNQLLEELGSKKNPYGYDGAYDNCTTFSMGSAQKVTVTKTMNDAFDADSTAPTATFTFKGTGFDIISLTDNTSGAIVVNVKGTDEATAAYNKNFLVNNYYGYTYNEGTGWETTDSHDPNALYQIPVMKVNGLDYGTYQVTITVGYSDFFDKTGDRQYSFWLDAIRVYDPMGKDNAIYNTGNENEGYPQYIKLHDALKNETATPNTNLLFIDGADKADIADYKNYGPNNEVYLAKGQAISFVLTNKTGTIASVQIGAKAPMKDDAPTMTVTVTDGASLTKYLETATEMYYELTGVTTGQTVTITNYGNGILSLTNLKITYTAEGGKVTLGTLTETQQNEAVMAVRALFTTPVDPEPVTFEPSRFEASWDRSVRAGQKATLTVKTSEEVESVTVNGETVSTYRTRTERSGWGWWAKKVTYREFTYTVTAAATADYTVIARNGDGAVSQPITATLTVRGGNSWWGGIFGRWF